MCLFVSPEGRRLLPRKRIYLFIWGLETYVVHAVCAFSIQRTVKRQILPGLQADIALFGFD